MLASEGEEFTRSMFSLFLFLSVVLIVFGYTPEDQESAKGKGIAYNPSADDEEIELRWGRGDVLYTQYRLITSFYYCNLYTSTTSFKASALVLWSRLWNYI